MKKLATSARARKLVLRAEAIVALTPPALVAVVGGENDMPLSKPPGCGLSITCTGTSR
jgi:hypothetical protein